MSKRKLLLADDSITIQRVVKLTFADEGIDVVTVGDGDAALEYLASETPDILLADVNMPGPTGYEICEKLRASEATRGVPLILLVGSFEPFDEAEAARVGANAYLTKPFQSIKQLIAQVNELMDAADASGPPEVSEEASPVELAPMIEDPSVAEEPGAADAQSGNAEEPVPKYFDDLGYEMPAQRVETSSPVTAAADDIDSLYHQSVAADELSDVGIDDEMIETSYSAPQANDELSAYASESGSASGYVGEEAAGQVITEGDVNAGSEGASGEAPAEEQSHADLDSQPGFRSGYEQRFPDDPSKFENTIAYENWKPADMRDGEKDPESVREADSETLKPLDTTPLDDQMPQPIRAITQNSPVGEDTIRMENRFETSDSSLKFDDTDLLDLSANGQTPVEVTSPVNAMEQGATKQLVTLSPELIEMIAQRVVEKLSEKY